MSYLFVLGSCGECSERCELGNETVLAAFIMGRQVRCALILDSLVRVSTTSSFLRRMRVEKSGNSDGSTDVALKSHGSTRQIRVFVWRGATQATQKRSCSGVQLAIAK